MSEKNEIHRGLQGVYFDRSDITFIDGKKGTLLYRGYSIDDLAEQSTFEEVCYLLIEGKLPNQNELDEYKTLLAKKRSIPNELVELIKEMKNSHPMDVLQTSISYLGSTENDNITTIDNIKKLSTDIIAKTPTVIACHKRFRENQDYVPPEKSLTHAENFLYMMTGSKPSNDEAQLIDKDFILHAEHSSNASSFTARVVAGTGASVYSAITAAIAALSGPAHGGAAENVMTMALEIKKPENAKSYVKDKRKKKQPIMGFGHRVYRTADPRAKHLKQGVKDLSEKFNETQWLQILEAVEIEMEPYKRLGVAANVDFYAGVIYYLLKIPHEFFVPIFAIGRIPGWIISIIEQYTNNILIRPLLDYNGPEQLKYIPINKR
tara:strand:- start:19192 stop:20322 length:1131 start_codon:yes stop_codon:yes gene_type:complete